jgi:hypothetical protein
VTRRLAPLALALVLAGCGTAEPKVPHALAKRWTAEATRIADHPRVARLLQSQFVTAVNAHQIPPASQETLGSLINEAGMSPQRARALAAWLRRH